jgi:putative N6-adenine-specific DNA methylase
MSLYNLVATSSFGLESVVARELGELGFSDLHVENGKISFAGNDKDLAVCNIRLRCADRLLVRMAEFRAADFEELFQGTRQIPWEDIIPRDGKMHVTGKSIKSGLFSVPDCQSVVKKAIVEAMKRKYRNQVFPETGPTYRIEVALYKDTATITLDTTGPGLHKRGYRTETGEAPLRETLAAALVLLSRWKPGRVLADPLCGSGTIAIEAALIGRRIAPGLHRPFVSEAWPAIPRQAWVEARDEARAEIISSDVRILASDIDAALLKGAQGNAKRAGVIDCMSFEARPLSEFRSGEKLGCLICNPPYGERLGEVKEAEKIYKTLGHVYEQLDGWSLFALTSHPGFERVFGKKADRKRKLYNGQIKCHFYQYFGPMPRRTVTSGK